MNRGTNRFGLIYATQRPVLRRFLYSELGCCVLASCGGLQLIAFIETLNRARSLAKGQTNVGRRRSKLTILVSGSGTWTKAGEKTHRNRAIGLEYHNFLLSVSTRAPEIFTALGNNPVAMKLDQKEGRRVNSGCLLAAPHRAAFLCLEQAK